MKKLSDPATVKEKKPNSKTQTKEPKLRVIRITDIKTPVIGRLKQLEVEAFGEGGFNQWVIPVFVRYGKVYALMSGAKYIGIAHFIRSFDDSDICFLAGFSLDKDHRGRGLGKYFLDECLRRLKRKKIRKVLLTVAPGNEPALKIYHALGFERTSLHKNEYGKGVHRLLLTIDLERINK